MRNRVERIFLLLVLSKCWSIVFNAHENDSNVKININKCHAPQVEVGAHKLIPFTTY
jgi:hypothetical protein